VVVSDVDGHQQHLVVLQVHFLALDDAVELGVVVLLLLDLLLQQGVEESVE